MSNDKVHSSLVVKAHAKLTDEVNKELQIPDPKPEVTEALLKKEKEKHQEK